LEGRRDTILPMRFELSRLRQGELIAGVSGVALIAFMFLLTWFGLRTPLGWTAATLGVPTSFNGWDSLTHARYLVLITALGAIALVYFQASRRAPAMPSALAVVVLALALLTLLVLIYRVLINVPGPGDLQRRAGAYLGLVSAAGIFYGAYRSLRQEGIRPQDGPAEIELVRLGDAGPALSATAPRD
jgi:hypothetical protein